MKFIVSFKCPDALEDAIREAVQLEVAGLLLNDADEREAIEDKRFEKTLKLCTDKWFEYGEYLYVEVDTEAMTCTVKTK